MYNGLSEEICQKAWNITKQSVLFAHAGGVTNRYDGTIVVCYPRLADDSGMGMDFILIEDIDPESPDREKYERIATTKAEVSWKTGLSSRKVQQDAPFLYEPGMTKWGGSVVENGLVVAFSGVQAVFDEAIAGTMLRWIVALCQDEVTREGGVMDSDSSFIGGMSSEELRVHNLSQMSEVMGS